MPQKNCQNGQKISNARSAIRDNIFPTKEARDYFQKYFDKFVAEGNFDEWLETVKKYDLSKAPNFEAHHVIPVGVFDDNVKLQKLLHDFNFEGFNHIDNAIPLPKKSIANQVLGHATHSNYDTFIRKEIDKILDDKSIDDFMKFSKMKELINKVKKKLEGEVLLGNKDVNDIISF